MSIAESQKPSSHQTGCSTLWKQHFGDLDIYNFTETFSVSVKLYDKLQEEHYIFYGV